MLCGSGSKKDKSEDQYILTGASLDEATMGTVRDLHDFLIEAELEHYYNAFKNELKIASVPQLKYVAEEDLVDVGMTKPEMRRLKKFYKKECPQGKLEKFKRAFMDKANLTSSGSTRTLSPSPPHNRISRPISYIRPTGKQIISSDSLEITKNLGEGEFGIVQQGLWQTEEGEKVQVAIKCLSRDRLENGTQEFLKEAGLMQTIDHENIVRMYGVVLDKDNTLMLVTELAPMRSLLEVLKDTMNRADFPLPRLCDFAQQICDGMSYLESKRLIHRDLAARNILVFSKSKVKISDFGLSRALGRGKDYYQSNFSINLKLPIAWCAPECINYLKFTSASDVWAFGVVLWELFTYGCQPWAGLNGQQILDTIDEPNNQRLNQPELCPKNYYDLMLQCWDTEPEKRPMFSEMFITLPQILVLIGYCLVNMFFKNSKMRPTQVKAVKDFPEITVPKGYIYYRAYDVIVVLDKSPPDVPVKGLWKGVLMNGQTGFFDPMNTVPFIEPKSSPETPTPKKSITRKDSKRSASKKLRTDMISRPQNDLRHTGHIGYDGAIFGDVSFIGDNYDKLPLKTASIGKLDESRNSINLSRMSESPDRNLPLSLSDSSLNGGPKSNGIGKSWISIESLESQGTLRTDEHDDTTDTGYHDIDDDSLLADFKMPDLSTSLDFGSSFMDEVLKALNEKEAQMDNSDKVSSTSPEDNFRSPSSERSRSMSPPKEMKAPPPPLPAQPPRVEPKPTPARPEPAKLQAKVKPMSTSDEKMMEDAILMANDLVSHSSQIVRQDSLNAQDKLSDTDSGSESPRLLSKIKATIKKSPKQERKRTFSDNLNKELEDQVPPEAQEAYNMLVVHGSVKDGSRSYQRQTDSSDLVVKRESLTSVGSSGHNFAYADSSSSSVSRTPDRTSPFKSVSRQSSERASASPPNLGRLQHESTPERPVPKPRNEPPTPPRRDVPVPRPRPEIHRVEPTPRPPPPPIPTESAKVETNIPNVFENPLAISEDDWKKSEESLKSDRNSQIETLRVEMPEEKVDRLNTSIDSGTKSTSPSDKSETSSKFSFFEEEFSEPSPREVMSKLARESRLRRSLDHQRGLSNESEAPVNRNLREPQGIPTKSFSTSNGDDDEVDTNPLRMLRGGVIPVRGGRVGSGMSSNKPTLRHPKLHFSTSTTLQHSVSVDAGRDSRTQSQTLSESEHESNDSAPPALPPRSFSICDTSKVVLNPLPLPPRNIRRTVSLNTKPRERIYPLKLDNLTSNTALSPPPSLVVSDDVLLSRSATSDNACHTENSLQVASSSVSGIGATKLSASSLQETKYRKPLPLPELTSSKFNPLHEADSTSLADLPLAPPPPTYKEVENNDKWFESEGDDNVFESPPKELTSQQVPSVKQSNLTSEGGSSGSSTFPRGFKLFGIKNVKCNLEQLGFYNHADPFWVQSVVINDQRSRSANSRSTEPDASPLMLANYKCSEGVSYEDLLDFALDRQKNGEEIELMQKLFGADVTREDCVQALEDTKWDLHKAIKYIKLKQLLSIQLGNASHCKEALLACDWNVQKAADYMLGKEGDFTSPPSPECVDV